MYSDLFINFIRYLKQHIVLAYKYLHYYIDKKLLSLKQIVPSGLWTASNRFFEPWHKEKKFKHNLTENRVCYHYLRNWNMFNSTIHWSHFSFHYDRSISFPYSCLILSPEFKTPNLHKINVLQEAKQWGVSP